MAFTGDVTAGARKSRQIPGGRSLDCLSWPWKERNAIPQCAADILNAGDGVQISRHQSAKPALAFTGEMVFDLALVRLQGIEEHIGAGSALLGEETFPSGFGSAGNFGKIRRTDLFQRLLQLLQELTHASCFDRLNLQAG